MVKHPIDTRRNLMLKIMKLSSRLNATYAKIYVPRYGIGVPEWRLLAVLGSVGPLPLIRIAEHASIDRGTITKAAERLRLQGAIKVETDEHDSRKRIASMTPLGIEIHDKIAAIAVARHEKLLEYMSPDDYSKTMEMLEKLDDALERLDVYVPPDVT